MNAYVLSSKNEHGDYTVDGTYFSFELAELAAFKHALYQTSFIEGDDRSHQVCQISNGGYVCFYRQHLNNSWISNDVFGLIYRIDKCTIDKNEPDWENWRQ